MKNQNLLLRDITQNCEGKGRRGWLWADIMYEKIRIPLTKGLASIDWPKTKLKTEFTLIFELFGLLAICSPIIPCYPMGSLWPLKGPVGPCSWLGSCWANFRDGPEDLV